MGKKLILAKFKREYEVIRGIIILIVAVLFIHKSIAQTSGNERTVLLVMDMQESVLSFTNTFYVTDAVVKAVSSARRKRIPVIYVRAVLRQGAPEISPDNKFFYAYKDTFQKIDQQKWSIIPQIIAPRKEDLIVDKKRISAFAGSDLDLVLRAKGYTNLILCGVSTSGVILSTVREAADKDYRITVLSDACADADKTVHEFLTKKIFSFQASVITVQQWQTNE